MSKIQKLSAAQVKELLNALEKRFLINKTEIKSLSWHDLEKVLLSNPEKLISLQKMESTGGEPGLLFYNHISGEYTFSDLAPESPKDRRSLCYDRAGLDNRKENKPASSAVDIAEEIGVELMTESEYKALQEMMTVDQKTSSWLSTPPSLRVCGGAIFGEHRYGRVFTFHNGAQSYYASRGFRGVLHIKSH